MSEPYAAHSAGRDQNTFLLQLVADSYLSKGRLVDRDRNNRFLDLRVDAVLDDGFLARDLLECRFATLVVEFLEPIETVP